MYRQKGTGNARAGSRRSNIRRGGGHAFAKKTRDFSYRLPRKAVRLATRMAMAGKIQSEQVVIVDDLKMDAPKTKQVADLLKAMEINGQSTLITTAAHDANVYKSARNIDRVSVSPVTDLNALSILQPQRLVVTKAAMDQFKEQAQAAKSDKK